MHVGGLILAGVVGILGCVYNTAVDKYADYKVSQWTYEKVPLDIRSTIADGNDDEGSIGFVTKSVNELRRTVSKRTGLVENTNDRRSWNAWITSFTSSSLPSSSLSASEEELTKPGNYTFMYRSYVNYEEAGCIKKSFLHLKTWYGIVANSRGYMTVHPDGNHVSITDIFRKRFFTVIVIRWNGVITVKKASSGGKKKKTIVWTDTEMIMDDGKIIKNPPQSEALRKTPWDIVKGEDGMFAFQRGDVGMLVYDSKTVP